MRKCLFLLVVLVCSVAGFGQDATEGSLMAYGKKGTGLGLCPLKTTSVKSDISGFLARVRVRQEFENTYTEPIEAVYVFPLSNNGAVDDMTMTVGSLVIHGRIMRRDEAKKTYEAAKSEGRSAALLDQERPNIFTQSVANIMPGESIVIEITYVETLKYEDGAYEFVFPMVVAPRYIPGTVKDAAKIAPPVAATRAGHDISIEVNLNAGVPVEAIRSSSHDIDQINLTPHTSKITLRDEKTIPNKDFILRYDVTGKRIEDAVLVHRDARGGFFTLILQPPDKIANEDRTPKEIVFVLDTSGSMGGFPIEKAKEAMRLSLDGLYPDDTFNLITFAGDTAVLFDKPVPATPANLQMAEAFLAERRGYGGTEMMKAIKAALDPSDAADHLRIVCFMTDGEVGNDDAIVAEVQRHPNARVFSFGIGSSVNRSLLDRIAREGKGEAEYVALDDDGSKAAKKFYERVRTPMLTDLSIDWRGLPVADIYPNRLTDLFSAKPVIVHGRYTKAASGKITLRGKVAGQPYEREIAVNLPESEAANDVLATLWARQRVETISLDSLKTANAAEMNKQIADIGLEFRLLTQFTSFIAVEDRVVNQNGKPVTVQLPVDLPAGMDRETTLGVANMVDVTETKASANITARQNSALPKSTGFSSVIATPRSAKNPKSKPRSGRGSGSGQGSGSANGMGTGYGYGNGNGSGSGNIAGEPVNTFTIVAVSESPAPPAPISGPVKTISGGVVSGKAISLPKPVYPQTALAVNARGPVGVRVSINEKGDVINATAVAGHPLLRQAAEKAAMASKFAPTSLGGREVKIMGMIVYNFEDAQATNIVFNDMKVGPLSPDDKKKGVLAEKLQIWLYALVDRLQKGVVKPAENEAMFVRDGKANIKVELTTMPTGVIDQLKAAGFEMVSEKGNTVVGRIAIDKIAALAEIGEVKLILPSL